MVAAAHPGLLGQVHPDRGGGVGHDGLRRSGGVDRGPHRRGPGAAVEPRQDVGRPAANWAVGGAASVLVFLFVSRREPSADAVAILMIGAAIYAFLESVRAGIDDNLVGALPTALAVYQMSLVFPPPLLRLRRSRRGTGPSRSRSTRRRPRSWAAFGVVRRSGAVAGGDRRVPDPRLRGLGRLRSALGVLPRRHGRDEARLPAQGGARRGAGRHGPARRRPRRRQLPRAGRAPAPRRARRRIRRVLRARRSPTRWAPRSAPSSAGGPFSPLTLRAVPAGTPGAVSIPGTAASLAGAALIALAGGASA